MKEIQEYLKIDSTKKTANAVLRIVNFVDNGYHIIYIPSLNLSSYGDSKEEAWTMMSDVVLDDFFENLLEHPKNIVFEHLKSLGWEKSPVYPKKLSHSVHIDRNGILKNFNLSEETEITETFVEV